MIINSLEGLLFFVIFGSVIANPKASSDFRFTFILLVSIIFFIIYET